MFVLYQKSSILDSNCELKQMIVVAILTIKEKAGILDAQSVRGHTGIVPIILLSDIGNHENSCSAKNLDIDALGIGQPVEERQTGLRLIQVNFKVMEIRGPDARMEGKIISKRQGN